MNSLIRLLSTEVQMHLHTRPCISRRGHLVFAPVANHFPHLLHTLSKIPHRWTIRESYKIDTLALPEMTYFTRIDVEENPGNTNDFMLDALFKEAKAENQEVKKGENESGFW